MVGYFTSETVGAPATADSDNGYEILGKLFAALIWSLIWPVMATISGIIGIYAFAKGK
jgi:hypothetical protein